jgi:hypothetical protein
MRNLLRRSFCAGKAWHKKIASINSPVTGVMLALLLGINFLKNLRVFKILCQGKASCRASLADHLNCSMNLRPKAAQNPQSI